MHTPETKSTRIVMRRKQVHKICANHQIASPMKLSVMQKSFTWMCNDFSDGASCEDKLATKLTNLEVADEFEKEFGAAIDHLLDDDNDEKKVSDDRYDDNDDKPTGNNRHEDDDDDKKANDDRHVEIDNKQDFDRGYLQFILFTTADVCILKFRHISVIIETTQPESSIKGNGTVFGTGYSFGLSFGNLASTGTDIFAEKPTASSSIFNTTSVPKVRCTVV